jgi:arginine repressor
VKQKTERLLTIREIILNNSIESQDELLKVVQSKGFESTQATLSRDLKQLKVANYRFPMAHMYILFPEQNRATKPVTGLWRRVGSPSIFRGI